VSANWRASALCAQVDPALMFPEKDEGKSSTRQARALCMRCEVRTPCLDEALADPSLEGVWGATTVRDRQAMRRGSVAA